MSARHRPLFALIFGLLGACPTVLFAAPASDEPSAAPIRAEAPAEPGDAPPKLPPDAPLEPYQARLLETAMESVSQMPLHPHIKNRSRAQHKVVQTCLKLDQPSLALEYLRRIKNWRQGASYAEYAHYCVARGYTDTVERDLRIALAWARLADQDWRKDQIRVWIGRTYLEMGDVKLAEDIDRSLHDQAFQGKMEADLVHAAPGDDYEQMRDRLDNMVAAQQFAAILNGGTAFVELYRRYYDNEERRDEIESRLRQAYKTMPGPDTIDMLIKLADVAISYGDTARALTFAAEAEGMFKAGDWADHREWEYQFAGKLAKLRCRADDPEGAVKLLDPSHAKLLEALDGITNIWRADAIRPIAEGYAQAGKHDRALVLYRRAIEVGRLNKNGRPRSEDLSETCLSLAIHRLEPGDELWLRIREARDELGHPW